MRQVRMDDVRALEVFREFAARLSLLRRMGKRIYIILPNPTAPAFEPRRMLTNRLKPDETALNTNGFISKPAFQSHVRPITAVLEHVAAMTGSTIIDPLDFFCEGSICRTNTADGKPKYRDADHLRSSYAKETATFIDEIMLHHPHGAESSIAPVSSSPH